MANTVEFCSVMHIICTPELYQAFNDLVSLSFSHLLSDEASSEKTADSIAT